jgi:ATP-dependent 26S proteasome regulatory subunit
MNVDPDVNYDELARCTDDFNGAQCKAVCVEAGTSKLETKNKSWANFCLRSATIARI